MKILNREIAWELLDKYKTNEGEYDLSKATEKEVLMAYEFLEDDDEVIAINDL
jgi:hypothetical protein